jgi:AraC-like DNA-binding protein
VLEFRRDRDVGQLSYAPYEALDLGAAQAGDMAMSATVKLVREICGRAIVPLEVRLPRRAPDDIEPYRTFFRCPVRFNEPEAVVVFHSETLRRPLPGAQPALRAALEHMMKQREAIAPLGFEEELRRAMRLKVVNARAPSTTIARQFDIDRRTINRRLKVSGSSFKVVADEMRYMVACQLLEDTELHVGEIAAALDFAEAASFTRAFQRWAGVAPGAWRARSAALT